ncbi:hypothetical protein IWT25_00136 [Secundilactobacillus pentosiphilus]|uniref:DUF4097 domain-containing protein n=1 Tax=Secundilactobacillus pentosiphilus TaxID=1714682 RepID=A0A1Z5ITD0_9LACO|nr:DUF4097 family beta strand repeat-containing protein [Secundilactobacillus pentosiphilus]GAX04842.1 hypothetical protein IWT25_00136 [Secundilactobacillus pentosiphilus]
MIDDNLISTFLKPIFANYPQTDDSRDFYNEVAADVREAAQDLLDSNDATTPEQAVKLAVDSLGDLTEPLQLISGTQSPAISQNSSANSSWSADLITRIVMHADETKVNLVASPDDQIHVHQYQQPKLASTKVQIKTLENTLSIEAPSPRWFQYLIPFRHPKSTVEIALPSQFAGHLEAELKSGTLSIENVKNQLQAKVVLSSGSLSINHAWIKTLSAQINSGQFKARHFASNSLQLDVHTGTIQLSNVESTFDISTHSGTIKGNVLTGKGQFTAHSGALFLDWQHVNGDVTVINHSGTVKIQTPMKDSFKFDLQAKSGTVKVTRNATYSVQVLGAAIGQVGDRPQYDVKVEDHSGTIRLS